MNDSDETGASPSLFKSTEYSTHKTLFLLLLFVVARAVESSLRSLSFLSPRLFIRYRLRRGSRLWPFQLSRRGLFSLQNVLFVLKVSSSSDLVDVTRVHDLFAKTSQRSLSVFTFADVDFCLERAFERKSNAWSRFLFRLLRNCKV